MKTNTILLATLLAVIVIKLFCLAMFFDGGAIRRPYHLPLPPPPPSPGAGPMHR